MLNFTKSSLKSLVLPTYAAATVTESKLTKTGSFWGNSKMTGKVYGETSLGFSHHLQLVIGTVFSSTKKKNYWDG